MIYYQKWEKDTFEYKYLKKIKSNIRINPNIKCYIGFDFGFFLGMNIYYGSNHDYKIAKSVYTNMKKAKMNIRLFTNIDYDFDVIILLGYSNIKKEREYLRKKYKKVMKALSFF